MRDVRLIERAENAQRESKRLDFKRDFDPKSGAAWCELIKDIVAFANSGGGIIVFGLNNDGSLFEFDAQAIFEIELADIANKIRRYTDCDFSEIEIIEICRDGTRLPAFLIAGVQVPMIFTKPGTYEVEPPNQRTAFSKGTLYFRHGSKSEPGTTADILKWRENEVERCRREWVKGIRKVVEAPAGHVINVISSPSDGKGATKVREGLAITARASADPGGLRFVPQNAEELWPYRQKDLLKEVNRHIRPASINGHDITCLNAGYGLLSNHPEFAYKPHRLASPQYSPGLVKWIVAQLKVDPSFFARLREEYRLRLEKRRAEKA
jgi:hypothetical protein